MQGRLVRLLCVFLTSLLRRSAAELAALGPELQAFCVQFSRIRLGKHDPDPERNPGLTLRYRALTLCLPGAAVYMVVRAAKRTVCVALTRTHLASQRLLRLCGCLRAHERACMHAHWRLCPSQ